MIVKTLYIKTLVIACLLASGWKSYAQDATVKFPTDTSFLTSFSLKKFSPGSVYLHHSPGKKDHQRYKKHHSLINRLPTEKNHALYFSLACSLWELEKIEDAKKMFLTIINSEEKYYSSTYYHSSDIPGDTSTNSYGYGSFTSDYKNYAALYLAKIYLEQKDFDKALQFVEDAVQKYQVTYSCGTGYYSQQNEYNFLYASCYEGLNRYADIIDLLIPSCLQTNDDLLIAAIKNTYSKEEILQGLQNAENSIVCLPDSFPSYSYEVSGYGNTREKTDTIQYYSGTATITLFDRQVNIPTPKLENGEHLAKDRFVKFFRESDFYTRLKEDP